MRADRPAVAELSGGLDSSTLVGIADMVSRESGGAIPRIRTMSRIYDKGNAGEDGYFIRLIEEHRNQTGLHVTEQDDPLLGPWPDPDFISFPRRFICTGGARRRGEALQAAGARVVLSGFIGDELLGQHPGPRDAGRLMRRGRWLRAFNLCREFSLERKRPALMLLRSSSASGRICRCRSDRRSITRCRMDRARFRGAACARTSPGGTPVQQPARASGGLGFWCARFPRRCAT